MYCAIGLMLGAAAAACSLEEHTRSQITEEKAYATRSGLFLNTVSTLYNYIGSNVDGQGLQGMGRCVYDLQTFSSDEAIMPTRGGDWFDGGMWVEMFRHTWTPDHEIINNSWLYLYKVITLCNYSLNVLATHRTQAGDDYQAWTAEIRTLRAMYYWYLLDLYGDVPLVTTTQSSMYDVESTPRSQVFDFCVSELTESLPLLAPHNSVSLGDYYGRMTQGVCLFVLAKLMLNAKVYTGTPRWQECIDYCDAIESMGYWLTTSYAENFSVQNEYSSENIFTIPCDKHLFSNLQQNHTRSMHYRHAAAWGFSGENGTSATRKVLQVNAYGTDSVDRRFFDNYFADTIRDANDVVVTDRIGNPLIYHAEQIDLDLSGTPYVETGGARMKKYIFDRIASKDGKLMDNDIVLFRFADVLLMRAEAKLRLGQDGQDDYDLVRSRAMMPLRPLTLHNLLDERLLELCWEGWRRQDLIRFGQFRTLDNSPSAIDESDGHTCIFPIPASARNMNPKLRQNKGY